MHSLMMVIGFAAALQTGSATADTRGPGANTLHKQLYCVRNAESGACEDCWSDGDVSSARGTCRSLKASTNAPNVRKGSCSSLAQTSFCKRADTPTGK